MSEWPNGATVKQVRIMTDEELENEGWETSAHDIPTAIEFEDGNVLFCSRDTEGNGPGVLFAIENGKAITLVPVV